MKKGTLRAWLKWSMLANLILFGLALVDHVAWENAAVIPILVAYAFLLVWLIIILLWRPSAPFSRLDAHDETRSVIVYPRNHG